MFAFDTPPGNRRLARIELVEGFAQGTTKAEIRMDAGNSSANVLARLSWPVDLKTAQTWRGGDLETPLRMNSSSPLWVVITPIRNSTASFSSDGKKRRIWHQAVGSESWREGSARLMFRAYCCKD